MKATARGHVEVEIRMVHAMHAPQCRDRMKHHMLQIDRQIQNEEPDDDRGEVRKVDIMQQSPFVPLDLEGKANGAGRDYETNESRV